MKEAKAPLSVWFSTDDLEKLRKLAYVKRVSKGRLVREIISKQLQEEKQLYANL